MFTTENEKEYFFKEISKKTKVLEYGSGQSTKEIAEICDSIVSIEHQKEWYDINNQNKSDNCKLVLKEPDLPYVEGTTCGTYEEFKSYVESPIEFGPYDVILIDGRARVACASICDKLSHKDTIIFIHDFTRVEYQESLKFLELIGMVETMTKFKLKNNDTVI
jgi:protein-L-isoaspartate O-methyltransferase